MSDVQTPAPTKTRQMSFSVLDDGTVRADFGEGVDPLTFNPATLPEKLFPSALAKGFIMFLQGRTSRLAGENRTPKTLHDAVAAGLTDLRNGIWTQERQAGAGGEISIEAEAAHWFRVARAEKKGEAYTLTVEQSAEAYAALSEDQQAKLKSLPTYKAAYAKVKAERQTAKAAKLAKKAETEEEIDF